MHCRPGFYQAQSAMAIALVTWWIPQTKHVICCLSLLTMDPAEKRKTPKTCHLLGTKHRATLQLKDLAGSCCTCIPVQAL